MAIINFTLAKNVEGKSQSYLSEYLSLRIFVYSFFISFYPYSFEI